MLTFKNPDWIKQFYFKYDRYEDIPQGIFDQINNNLDLRTSTLPIVSIIIPAMNEEINLLRSIASLSQLDTKIPFEIIVVNNNSTDQTQKTIDKLHIRSFVEYKQGCGSARQKGQENARGKYVLLADADVFYPAKWLDLMISALSKKGVVVVYGRYCFLSEPGFSRWQLAIHETLKNFMVEIRHYKRPFLNTGGASMGYIKELGLKVGFITSNYRGSDGTMTYDLMRFGKVKQVRSNNATVWTYPRSLQRDGTFFQALVKRVVRDLGRFGEFFHSKMKYHAPRE